MELLSAQDHATEEKGKLEIKTWRRCCSKADNLLSGMFHSQYYPDKIAVRLCWVTQKANQCLIFQARQAAAAAGQCKYK